MRGSVPQVFCPKCRGGNPPQAYACQWCGRALVTQHALSSPYERGGQSSCLGTGLLVTGILSVMLACLFTVAMTMGSRNVWQEQSSLLMGGILILAALVLFVLPGAVLLIVRRR